MPYSLPVTPPVAGHTSTGRPVRAASVRASAREDTTSDDSAESRFLAVKAVSAGMATDARIASTATVTIISTSVKPRTESAETYGAGRIGGAIGQERLGE